MIRQAAMPNHAKTMANAVTAMLTNLPLDKQPSQAGLPDSKKRDDESKKKREAFNDSVYSATKRFLKTTAGSRHPANKTLKDGGVEVRGSQGIRRQQRRDRGRSLAHL